MNAEQIRNLLRAIGARNVDRPSPGQKWVMCSCPLAPYKSEHRHSEDERPSFGVSVHANSPSIVNCFTCHQRSTVAYFVALYGRITADPRIADIAKDIEQAETFGFRAEQVVDMRRRADDCEEESEPFDPMNWEAMEPLVDWPEGLDYYLSRIGHRPRGSLAHLEELPHEVAFDPEERRVVFALRDEAGEIAGMTGRSIDPQQRLKVRDYFGTRKEESLLGLDVARSGGTAIIVEGLFDYARASFLTRRTFMASMHSGLTPKQADILVRHFDNAVLMFDNDAAGQSAVVRAAEVIAGRIGVLSVDWSVLPSNIKDPGDMSRRQFAMLETTELPYMPKDRGRSGAISTGRLSKLQGPLGSGPGGEIEVASHVPKKVQWPGQRKYGISGDHRSG